jgi:hypothetical protein
MEMMFFAPLAITNKELPSILSLKSLASPRTPVSSYKRTEITTLCPLTRVTICIESCVTRIAQWACRWIEEQVVHPTQHFNERILFPTLSACEMGDRWVDLITLMLANPPDPTEKLPLSNQRNTIWGTTLTFLVQLHQPVFFPSTLTMCLDPCSCDSQLSTLCSSYCGTRARMG